LGDRNGDRILWLSASDVGRHSMAIHSDASEVVTCRTLDSYLEECYPSLRPRIRYVKIDVEGFELEVCEGAITTLSGDVNVLVEFSPCFLGPARAKDFLDIVERLGFHICVFLSKSYRFHLSASQHIMCVRRTKDELLQEVLNNEIHQVNLLLTRRDSLDVTL
jgi:hypothetical protein